MSYNILCTGRRWFKSHSILVNDIDKDAAFKMAAGLVRHFEGLEFHAVCATVMDRETGDCVVDGVNIGNAHDFELRGDG